MGSNPSVKDGILTTAPFVYSYIFYLNSIPYKVWFFAYRENIGICYVGREGDGMTIVLIKKALVVFFFFLIKNYLWLIWLKEESGSEVDPLLKIFDEHPSFYLFLFVHVYSLNTIFYFGLTHMDPIDWKPSCAAGDVCNKLSLSLSPILS